MLIYTALSQIAWFIPYKFIVKREPAIGSEVLYRQLFHLTVPRTIWNGPPATIRGKC
jgi:hypothetical protein